MIDTLISYFSISYESLFVLIATATACALLSPFLVLRKLSMVSDAISHAVGIVFPMFFALAVVLITKFARNVHLDTDIVLMGEVIIAPLNRTEFLGMDLPKAFVQMGILFIVNLLFIIIFFKELKITTFDKGFAKLAGFSSVALFYALMTLSSLTAVTAFDAVGAILVVSFLITPGAAAYLISKDLKVMIAISVGYAVINSVLGYVLSLLMNVSMSGMTAAVAGVTFLITFLFNKEGLITAIFIRLKRKSELKPELFLTHIGNHSGKKEEIDIGKNIYDLTEKGREKFLEIEE